MTGCCFNRDKKIYISDIPSDCINKTIHGENIYNKKQLIKEDTVNCSMNFLFSFFENCCCKEKMNNGDPELSTILLSQE
jgi:hypothetical protein